MIVSQFQTWAENAPAPSRADGVSALARAVLYSDMDPHESQAAVRALTGFLDDPSPLVRLALAYAFASAAEAPHHIVLALAEDQPEIASIILGRSPILRDAELIDCAATATPEAQCAIAGRYVLSAPVAAALAEVGDREALVVLATNIGAILPDAAILRMIERHGDHAALREALLARDALPIDARAALVTETANALMAFVADRGWMSPERAKRVTREASEKATVCLAAGTRGDTMTTLAWHLRDNGQLTVALALRALLSGNRTLFDAALADLAGLDPARVAGLTQNFQSTGFAALYRKAGFPSALLPAFRLALSALHDHADEGLDGSALSLGLVERVLAGCLALDDSPLDGLMVLLRRFEVEAAKSAARAEMAAPAALALAMDVAAIPAIEVLFVEPSVIEPSISEHLSLEASEAPPVLRAWPDDTRSAAIHFDEAIPTDRATHAPEPSRFTIDFAALEAELMAA